MQPRIRPVNTLGLLGFTGGVARLMKLDVGVVAAGGEHDLVEAFERAL